MAANVLKHSIALFLILALDLVPVACGLLRRDQQDTEAQCASDVALTTFKAQKDAAQSFCSAYLPNTLQTITALSVGLTDPNTSQNPGQHMSVLATDIL